MTSSAPNLAPARAQPALLPLLACLASTASAPTAQPFKIASPMSPPATATATANTAPSAMSLSLATPTPQSTKLVCSATPHALAACPPTPILAQPVSMEPISTATAIVLAARLDAHLVSVSRPASLA